MLDWIIEKYFAVLKSIPALLRGRRFSQLYSRQGNDGTDTACPYLVPHFHAAVSFSHYTLL